MKTTILWSLFMLLALGHANAQFLEIGDKWIFDYRDYRIGNGSYYEKFDSIVVVSDTLINGMLYHKLVASESFPCGVYYKIEFLREDGDKIYRLKGDQMDENLMIDFSNQPSYDMTFDLGSEEIQTLVINDSTGTETLSSGETIELIYQRIINNSSFDDDAIYKLSSKVGYLDPSLLFPNIGTGLCDVDIDVNLRCKISGTDTIRLTDLDCFEPSVTSSAKDISLKAPLVFPNPTQGIIKMEEPYRILGIQNVAGSFMKFTTRGNEIDISTFPNGIYFLKLKDDRTLHIYTQKIVKM